MNPHFIFNSINSIQYYILKNEKEQAYIYLTKFSQLMRNILINSRKNTISLEEELKTLEIYMKLEALRFDNYFEYSN